MSAPGSLRSIGRRRSRRRSPDGKVEILVTEADGKKFDGPNDLTFGPDGRLYFTDSGDWNQADKPHPGRIVVIEKNGTAKILEELDYVYPNGIVAEPDGSIVWVESYTLRVVRRTPDGKKTRHPHACPTAISRTGSRSTSTAISGSPRSPRAASTIIRKDGTPIDFLEIGGTILNCCFGKGGKLFCCDMGPFDTSGAAMTGRLVEVDVGVEGMPLFRGAIG